MKFLDDQLIDICLNAEINDPEDVQETYDELIDHCQNYYKGIVQVGMSKKEVKIIIDRTFHLWNSFVRAAKNHHNPQVMILGGLCENYTFKDAFMSDPKLFELYESLKRHYNES